MGVFDSNTKTLLAVADPGTDHLLPRSASLHWKSIANVHALAGTHGYQARLVHGERIRKVSCSQKVNIARNLRTTVGRDHVLKVGGDQKIVIVGEHKETIAGRCQQSILGPHIVLNGTVRNELRLGARTLVYGGHEVTDTNSGNFVTATDHDERYGISIAHHTFDYQFLGISFQLMGVQLIGYLLTLSATALDAVLALMHLELVLSFYEHHVIHAELHVC